MVGKGFMLIRYVEEGNYITMYKTTEYLSDPFLVARLVLQQQIDHYQYDQLPNVNINALKCVVSK